MLVHAAQPGDQPKSGMAVWDTIKPAGPFTTSADLGQEPWVPLQGKTADKFTGDAVISNGRIAIVMRQQESALEVYALKPGVVARRMRLQLLTSASEPAVKCKSMAVIDSTKSGACLEAVFTTDKGTDLAARFRIKRGEVTIQTEPLAGAGKLRVECPGRFVILPDFFADDIALDAVKLPATLSTVDLPSENFILHPTADGDALGMCVFETRQQDVRVKLDGKGDKRIIAGSDIGFEGKKIWVALLESPQVAQKDASGMKVSQGIWHTIDMPNVKPTKVTPLGWKMPFPAQWRVDFNREGDLTDSWEMLLQDNKGGSYTKPSWLGSGDERIPPTRVRWNTVLGTYPYPCWSDSDRIGYIQPLWHPHMQFVGPLVIYPINRVKQTPLDAYTVVDVMRNTLGVGPCEHILDLEGQRSEYRGTATCAVRDTLNPIYSKKQQVTKKTDVDRLLNDGLTFVKHIRGRITRYVEFGAKMRQYLAEQKKDHPELEKFIDEMTKLNDEIDKKFAARKDKIQTPEHLAKMNEQFRKDVLGYEGPDALERCKEYTAALVVIGDNQDELSGECRWAIKTLRQRAGILMALDPRVAPIAAEIRTRTQEVLRNPASHEGARH
jgi:hypothetical protein